MNEKIISVLNSLYNQNYNLIKNASIKQFFKELIGHNSIAFNFNLGALSNFFDDDEVKIFKNAIKNDDLIQSFLNAKKMEINEPEIITNFVIEIKKSIGIIKDKIAPEKKQIKNQIIFLEYDFQPYAYFNGFGKGEYPILESPKYFDYKEELYVGIGTIDYSFVWKNLIELNEILEELDVLDQLIDTEMYQYLLKSYIYKTYILLHKAFDQIDIKEFSGIEIEKPLYIYGNEHDCEKMNIYVFE